MHGRVLLLVLLLVEYPVSALPRARYSKHTIELRSRVLTKSAHGRAPLLLVWILSSEHAISNRYSYRVFSKQTHGRKELSRVE